MSDYLAWQLRSRLISRPISVPFVNNAVLLVRHGMHGATQNIYCGLADFNDMGFLLHLLRPGDLFADVGANVGTYTVLASAAIGARSIAFEPNPETYPSLVANIAANGIADRVDAHRAGVGVQREILQFQSNGTQTSVATGATNSGKVFESPVVTLNESLIEAAPTLIKIDVEGFESDVLAGATDILNRPELLALIIENNDQCVKFGFQPDQAHNLLLAHGFEAANYFPRERKLEVAGNRQQLSQNSIYIRNRTAVQQRLASAPPFHAKDQSI